MSRFDSITMTHHYDSSLWLSRGSYSMLNQTIAFQSHGCIPKLYFFSKYMSTDSAPFHSLLMCQHFGALRLMVSYLVLRRPIRSRAPLARGFRLALGHPWRTRATPASLAASCSPPDTSFHVEALATAHTGGGHLRQVNDQRSEVFVEGRALLR